MCMHLLKRTPLIYAVALSQLFNTACVRSTETNSPEPETNTEQVDPLPSWNEGSVKQAIITFVTDATDSMSAKFIPVNERIATFDNDGTLWAERPYVQELFAMSQIKRLLQQDPTLINKPLLKAAASGDKTYFEKGGMKAMLELLLSTHTGMTEDEFERQVAEFFATATYPGRNTPLRNIRYQPQLELLDYLRANSFKTYICTGGTLEFVRAISMPFYGIPAEQVIGTTFKYVFVDSSRKILRQPALDRFNDQQEKPVGIQLHIGKPPVLACGNEGGHGDIAMLKFSQTSRYPSLQLMINHDDGEREYAYGEKDSLSVVTARKNRWQVVSIKQDWKKVFSE